MSFDFSRLPIDLQKAVTSYLPPESLTKSSPVSKLFQKMVENSPAWKIAADKLKLKNVTKENARGRVLEHLKNVDIIKSIARSCIPLDETSVISGGYDLTTLQKEIEEKFREKRSLNDFHDSLLTIAFKVNNRLPVNLKVDPLVFKDKELLFLEHLINVIKANKNEQMAKEVFTKIQSEFDTYPISNVFVKSGVFDFATEEDFSKCIFRALEDHHNTEKATQLLPELLKALQDHTKISNEKKAEILKSSILYFAEKGISDKECLSLLMEKSMSPPEEAVQKVIRLFISTPETHVNAKRDRGDLLEVYIKHSPLPLSTLKNIVERVRLEKPNDKAHAEQCNHTLARIEAVLKQKGNSQK